MGPIPWCSDNWTCLVAEELIPHWCWKGRQRDQVTWCRVLTVQILHLCGWCWSLSCLLDFWSTASSSSCFHTRSTSKKRVPSVRWGLAGRSLSFLLCPAFCLFQLLCSWGCEREFSLWVPFTCYRLQESFEAFSMIDGWGAHFRMKTIAILTFCASPGTFHAVNATAGKVVWVFVDGGL